MWLLYDLVIHIYGDAIRIASLFNPKARAWVKGRKGIFTRIKSAVGSQQSAVAWFHCASLGEFEQGRPLIEAFRQKYPDWKILLTFFSPSGYEIRKNYDGADWVFYLPLDTPPNSRKFIRTTQPSIAIFVKYEFWFRYLGELYKNRIPTYVISANFRPGHHFFKWYGAWGRKQLKKVTHFFVQHENSAHLLRNFGVTQVTVTGDTRFDRVAEVAAKAKTFPLVAEFSRQMSVFLAGSTWPEDEALILELIRGHSDKIKFIIAPHEVDEKRILSLQSAVGGQQSAVVLFSGLTADNATTAQVIIVDGIGYLSHLYQYATIAYIGGGFGAGIHNILEAATFGKPVIFGPRYHKFREAVDLADMGGAFPIKNFQQLEERTSGLLDNDPAYQQASRACSSYVHDKQGATKIILKEIEQIFINSH